LNFDKIEEELKNTNNPNQKKGFKINNISPVDPPARIPPGQVKYCFFIIQTNTGIFNIIPIMNLTTNVSIMLNNP
jgi:hypothetical protein